MIRISVVFALLVMPIIGCRSDDSIASTLFSQEMRAQVLRYVRQQLENSQAGPAPLISSLEKKHWQVLFNLYDRGRLIFESEGNAKHLDQALEAALKNAVIPSEASFDLSTSRIFISLVPKKGVKISFVEFAGSAFEIVGEDLVAVRYLDKARILTNIRRAETYLLHTMHPELHGFYKFYFALEDRAEHRLRTIYTASSLFSLLKLNDFEPNPVIEENIAKIADFLLSMQLQEGPYAGAFYYSLNLENHSKKHSLVVGTASKTIFTLLDLHRRFTEPRYLDAAIKAGEWLIQMQREDGSLTTSLRLVNGEWVADTKGFSTLYHGQVLSAFSRLYLVTREKKYLDAASKLGNLMLKRAQHYDYFLRDDFRPPRDPVPSSWGIMSLLDFYKATGNPDIKMVLLRLIREVLKKQKTDPRDLLEYGRFKGVKSSGNGWINEVLSEVYLYGKANAWDKDCLKEIKDACLLVTRWLIQNTYSPENTYFLPNPERAIGGLIRNYSKEFVRTDAVCHGVNAYLNMFDEWQESPLLEL